ncbi:MAG: T9SS type A sorting domain-containing protein [Crocinitomicaceae bacterium]
MHSRKLLMALAALILSFHFLGQTGPGGVGNNSGTSNLKIWLRADDINADNDFTNNPAVNSSVSQWRDYSGTNYHFSNTGVNRPTYRLAGGIPSVYFNASLANAQYLDNSVTGSYSNASAFFACNGVNSGNSNTLLDNTTNSLRFEQYSNTGVIGFTRYGVADYNSSLTSPFGTNSIISFHKTNSNNSIDILSNTSTDNVGIGSSSAGIPIDGLGRNSSGVDEISGDFYEVIVYNSRINTAQLIIVNNYLSSKYTIAVPDNIYVQDLPANGNYRYDVAGIGQIDNSNRHDDSQGTGMVRILNPAGLGDNEFLIWGHNNALAEASNTTDVPATVMARFQRVWRVNEVRTSGSATNVGNIDMQFDLSNLGSITASDVRLLIDINNNGIFSDDVPISGAVLVSGSTYAFNNVSQIVNNRRFTIGTINSSATPLPIGLLYFDAKMNNQRTVDLSWQTASETNNDYFTIERSKNGSSWETIGAVTGAGNSFLALSYQSIDPNPLMGISYYRLKQTDFDGKFTYSKSIAVNNQRAASEPMVIFPNPTHQFIHVLGEIKPTDMLEFYNSMGQNVSAIVPLLNSSGSLRQYDVSALSSGLYFLTHNDKVYKIEIQ